MNLFIGKAFSFYEDDLLLSLLFHKFLGLTTHSHLNTVFNSVFRLRRRLFWFLFLNLLPSFVFQMNIRSQPHVLNGAYIENSHSTCFWFDIFINNNIRALSWIKVGTGTIEQTSLKVSSTIQGSSRNSLHELKSSLDYAPVKLFCPHPPRGSPGGKMCVIKKGGALEKRVIWVFI